MGSETGLTEDSWVRLPSQTGLSGAEFSQQLDLSRDGRLKAGEYTDENIRYVSKLSLAVCSGELKLSDQKLEKLRRLCQLWDVKLRPREIRSHRKFVGPVIVAVKRAIYPILKFFLKDMLHQQREFNAATIRLLAEVARDDRSESK